MSVPWAAPLVGPSTSAAAADGNSADFDLDEPVQPRLVRSPVTLIRFLLVSSLTALAASMLSKASETRFASQLRTALTRLPDWLVNGAVGALQLALLILVALGVVALLLGRRWRRLGRILLAVVLAVA